MALNNLWDLVIVFLNSSFFAGLATILTGGLAIYLYTRQKIAERVQAARVLIQEIRDTEEKVQVIAEKLSFDPDEVPPWSGSSSWSKYAHLFSRDFDQDEIRALNEFYSNYETIQEMVTRQRNFYWLTTEERARVTQQVLAGLITEGKTDQEIRAVLDRFSSSTSRYAPQRIIDILQRHVAGFERLSTTILGEKLKKLATKRI